MANRALCLAGFFVGQGEIQVGVGETRGDLDRARKDAESRPSFDRAVRERTRGLNSASAFSGSTSAARANSTRASSMRPSW